MDFNTDDLLEGAVKILNDEDQMAVIVDNGAHLLVSYFAGRAAKRAFAAARRFADGEELSRREAKSIFDTLIYFVYLGARNYRGAVLNSEKLFATQQKVERSRRAKKQEATT